jgi:hypothetical protein
MELGSALAALSGRATASELSEELKVERRLGGQLLHAKIEKTVIRPVFSYQIRFTRSLHFFYRFHFFRRIRNCGSLGIVLSHTSSHFDGN